MECMLCKVRTADKTGSHILPHFLLKRIENIEGKTGRDYELGFTLSNYDTTAHFGRSVPKPKLNEVFGELSDSELAENKHPLVVNNYFCTKCEERFSKIENIYASSLYKVSDKVYTSGIVTEQAFLFWTSIIWRLSVYQDSNMQLSESRNEKLRRILDRWLVDDYDTIDFADLRVSKEAKRISYRLFRCPGFSAKNPTHMAWHPKFIHPYIIVIDEFILFYAFKDNFNDLKRRDFLRLKNVLRAPVNKFYGQELIMPTLESEQNNVNEGLIQELKEARIESVNKFLDRVHQRLGGVGIFMQYELKAQIWNEITSEEKELGRKYTSHDLIKSTAKVLKNYLK